MNYDAEYLSIINDIFNNKKFNDLKKINHHGITRYEHSLFVSYDSYLLAKKFNLDFVAVARAGLLHDYFEHSNELSFKEHFKYLFNHSKEAEINALTDFNVSSLEKDIIRSHMYPIGLKMPKYKESWLVSYVDKRNAFKELFRKNVGFLNNLVFRYSNYFY